MDIGTPQHFTRKQMEGIVEKNQDDDLDNNRTRAHPSMVCETVVRSMDNPGSVHR